MTEPTRLRYYRATDKSMSCAVGTVRALPVVPLPGAYEPLPELDRLVELLPRIERWVAMENAATEPSQPASEILAELEAAPPQPDKPLSVEEAKCPQCGCAKGNPAPTETMTGYATFCGHGFHLQDPLGWTAIADQSGEQAAAAERKEPASETRPVRVFRANYGLHSRGKSELIAVEKIGDRWTFGPNSNWWFSDDNILAKLASVEWSELTGSTAEPSAEIERLKLCAQLDAIDRNSYEAMRAERYKAQADVEEKYPLTVEQASGRRVCRICGMSPVEQTLDGEGDVLECAHPDCLDREQAAASERKEPATVGMRDDAFSPADIDELKKMREESGNPNLGKSTRPPRSIPLAEPSAKSEPQLTDWERSELGIKAMHKAYAMLGSGFDDLKQQLAAANALLKTEKYEHSHTLSQRDKAQAELRAWREAV